MPVVTCAKAKAQHEKPWIFDGVASQNQWKARHGTTLCSKKRPKKQRHGKRIACHRARQGIAHGKAIKAKAWQADCFSLGKAMHCTRHAKTKGGQGMTHGMPKQGLAPKLLGNGNQAVGQRWASAKKLLGKGNQAVGQRWASAKKLLGNGNQAVGQRWASAKKLLGNGNQAVGQS